MRCAPLPRLWYRYHIDVFMRADYENEKECGEGLRRAITRDVVVREEVWVVSKLWNTFHRKEHVKEAVMRSLKDWGVSYFDLYYVHFRACFQISVSHLSMPPDKRTYSHFTDIRSPG